MKQKSHLVRKTAKVLLGEAVGDSLEAVKVPQGETEGVTAEAVQIPLGEEGREVQLGEDIEVAKGI